jgi:MFS family permease
MAHKRIQDVLAYACLLNLFTFYSFYLPGLLLMEFSKSFPSALLFSTSAFLVGFIVRPIGALFLGQLADRRSRMDGLRISVLLIGISSCLVCILPDGELVSYYVLRVIQGFALGGCYPILSIIIYESAPAHQRGLYTGLFQTSVPAGYLFAIAVTIVSKLLIGEAEFMQNGWRTAFIYSFFIFPVWWQLHKTLRNIEFHDEPEIARKEYVKFKSWNPKEKKGVIFAFLLAVAVGSIAITGVNIKGFFLKSLLQLEPLTLNQVVAYSTIFYAPTYALWGALADRVGPGKVCTFGLIAGIVFILPLFKVFELAAVEYHIPAFSPSWFVIFLTSVTVSVIATACFGPFVLLVCEMVHHEHRCTLYGLVYNIATGIVGGSAYLVSNYVFENFRSIYGGIAYIVLIALVSGCAAYLYRKRNIEHFPKFIR